MNTSRDGASTISEGQRVPAPHHPHSEHFIPYAQPKPTASPRIGAGGGEFVWRPRHLPAEPAPRLGGGSSETPDREASPSFGPDGPGRDGTERTKRAPAQLPTLLQGEQLRCPWIRWKQTAYETKTVLVHELRVPLTKRFEFTDCNHTVRSIPGFMCFCELYSLCKVQRRHL